MHVEGTYFARITLRGDPSIALRIVHQNSLILNAPVVLLVERPGREASDPADRYFNIRGTADANGTIRISMLMYPIFSDGKPHKFWLWTSEDSRRYPWAAGELPGAAEQTISVAPMQGTIRGRETFDDGKGIPKTKVLLKYVPGPLDIVTYTGEDGSFEFSDEGVTSDWPDGIHREIEVEDELIYEVNGVKKITAEKVEPGRYYEFKATRK